MGFSFYKILNGLRLIPSGTAKNSQAGDMEFLTADNKLHLFNGTIDSPVVTEDSAVLNNPDITIKTAPLKFEETGVGTDVISVLAPDTIASSFTFKLPPDMGTNDYVLRTNGVDSTSWVPPTVDAVPSGVIMDFAGNEASVPASWLLLYGQTVTKSLYPNLDALFHAQGYPWGASNASLGVGTMNLPDCRGRVTAGRDNMGGSAAGRLTSTVMTPDGNTMGAVGGTQTHILTEAQLAAHDHDATGLVATASSSSLSGTITASGSNVVSGTVGGSDGTHTHDSGTLSAVSNGAHTHGITEPNAGLGHQHAFAFSNGGGGTGVEDTGDAGGSANTTFAVSGITINSDGAHTHTMTGSTGSTGSGHGHAFSLTAAAPTISHAGVVALAQSIVMSGDTADAGSGTAHLNTQPTIIFNKIIKT